MTETGRLSPQQWQLAQARAVGFRDQLVHWTTNKATGNTAFYPELFWLAAQLIEKDADAFCDRAQAIFDEIDAYGQEPQLDSDWLQELTGEKDSFYFSTDILVSELPPLPGQKRGRKPRPPDERDVVEAVQQAISEAEEDVRAIAYEESPSDWILKIATALKENHGTADFGLLRKATGLSPGALLIGLLLGHEQWILRQVAFYGEVEVRSRNTAE